jgi:hypothetical protein
MTSPEARDLGVRTLSGNLASKASEDGRRTAETHCEADAFIHDNGHGVSVYWDSPEQLCGAELQAPNDNLNATESYRKHGKAGFYAWALEGPCAVCGRGCILDGMATEEDLWC